MHGTLADIGRSEIQPEQIRTFRSLDLRGAPRELFPAWIEAASNIRIQ